MFHKRQPSSFHGPNKKNRSSEEISGLRWGRSRLHNSCSESCLGCTHVMVWTKLGQLLQYPKNLQPNSETFFFRFETCMHINLAWPHLLIPMSSDMCDPPPARQAWGKLWEGPGSISHLASMVEGIRPWQRLSARPKFHQWLDVYLFWEKFGNFHLLAPSKWKIATQMLGCSKACLSQSQLVIAPVSTPHRQGPWATVLQPKA